MNTKSLVRNLATLLGAVTLASVASVLPAQAQTANVNGTTEATASCDYGYRTMSMTGKFQLSSRYPRGAWIETSYARWNVDRSTRRQIGAIVYTPFTVSWAVPGTVSWNTGLEEGVAAQWSNLPPVTVANTAGALIVAVKVAVWNGSAWEMGNWDTQNYYLNVFRNTPWENGGVCLGSV